MHIQLLKHNKSFLKTFDKICLHFFHVLTLTHLAFNNTFKWYENLFLQKQFFEVILLIKFYLGKMLILFIHKIEVVFELIKELYTIIKWDFKNMFYNVHLFKEKMKQFDIHYFLNLFYFQNQIQLNIIFRKFENKWVLSYNIFYSLCKSKFDSFFVDQSHVDIHYAWPISLIPTFCPYLPCMCIQRLS